MGAAASLIRQVVLEQHSIKVPVDFVKRDAYQKLLEYSKSPQIVVITGLRRVGKSTLLQQLRSQSKESDYYINFDDDRLVNFELADFQVLLEILIELYGIQQTFYFDEIQNIAGWERFIRRLHDQGKKIYITGSNTTLFSQELGTRLTGRYFQLELFPYSFSEQFHHQHPDMELRKMITTEQRGLAAKAFNHYRISGGIPIYVHTEETEVLQSLYESVLYRDIITRYKITSDRAIKELVFYLASNVGKEFSFSGLAKQIGVGSPTTISDFCHYLGMSYLCYSVPRFSHSVNKQKLYNKKSYFIDHAMARVLGFRSSEDKGRLFENLIFIELLRRNGSIYFHKEKKECDFLVRRQGKVCEAYQVCIEMHDINTRERELEGLIEAMDLHNLDTGTIITEQQEEKLEMSINTRTVTIDIIPAWKWLGLVTVQ